MRSKLSSLLSEIATMSYLVNSSKKSGLKSLLLMPQTFSAMQFSLEELCLDGPAVPNVSVCLLLAGPA